MKIALYGGSFNPPHISHVLSATYVSMVENFDKIFVIPCFSSVTGKNLLPFRHRINMSNLAFKNIPNIYVSNIEDSLPIPSYTLNTVLKFKEIYPEAEIHLIVGADIMATQHLS